MYLDPNKSIRFINFCLYAYLATSVYFSKNWSRKDAQFFLNIQNYFKFKKGRNASKAKFHIWFKLIKHGRDYIERFFNIFQKKIFDSGFKFSINDPPMEKALLPILIKNLNIILNEYFHQFKSLKKNWNILCIISSW